MKLALSICIGFILNQTAIAAYDTANMKKSSKLKLVRITPRGNAVPAGRQITFKFNRAMAAVGNTVFKPVRNPIKITPEPGCEWRWLNTTTLACQLTEQNRLKLATRYRVEINPGFQALDQKILHRKFVHIFNTQRPKITNVYIHKWLTPGTPVLEIQFNQKVSRESVQASLSLLSKRRRYKITVSPTAGNNKSSYDANWRIWPARKLPLNTRIRLAVIPGLLSAQGKLTNFRNNKVFAFHSYPHFKYLGISCRNKQGRLIKFKKSVKSIKKCRPDSFIRLRFSAPINIESLVQHLQIRHGRTRIKEITTPASYYHNTVNGRYNPGQEFVFNIEDYVKANAFHSIKINSQTVEDLFQRKLASTAYSAFRTLHYQPHAFPASPISVIEKNKTSFLPFYAMNLQAFDFNYKVITHDKTLKNKKRKLRIRKRWDKEQIVPLNLSRILSGQSGIVIGTWKTDPKTWSRNRSSLPGANSFLTQVTPFQVHFKYGFHNSLAWITRIDNGKIVKNAKIRLFSSTLRRLGAKNTTIAETRSDKNGIARLPGKHELHAQKLQLNTYNFKKPVLYLHVEQGNDMALLPINSNFQINNFGRGWYRHYNSAKFNKYNYLKAWGFTAQGIYKLGDRIQYKLIVRDQGNFGLTPAPGKYYTLTVKDPLGKTIHSTKKIRLSKFGTLTGKFNSHATGTAGWYQFHLKPNFSSNTLSPLKVLITDFKPAAFRVSDKLNKSFYRTNESVRVNTSARLHSGGPYGNVKTRITSQVRSSAFVVNDPIAKGFDFQINPTNSIKLDHAIVTLNQAGNAQHEFEIEKNPVKYGTITVESAVSDDRGKYISSRQTAHYAGVDYFVGVRHDNWTLKADKKASIRLLVANANRKLVENVTAKLVIEYRRQSQKKKQKKEQNKINNTNDNQSTRTVYQWVHKTQCQVTSALQPVHCDFTPDKAGYYRLTAMVTDSKGRTHKSQIYRWASGNTRLVWRNHSGFTARIQANKKDYKVGETALFTILNPFPGAKALVTIERLGVIDSWVTQLDHSVTTLKVPVKPNYLPGFYLSVVIASPNGNQTVQNDTQGRPIRIGSIRIPVTGNHNRFAIDVKTDHKEYLPGSLVKTNIQVKNQHGQGHQSELAIAVIDEAVYDLIQAGRLYYDPHSGLYQLDGYDVTNYNLLKQLINHKSLLLTRKLSEKQARLYALKKQKTESKSKRMRYNRSKSIGMEQSDMLPNSAPDSGKNKQGQAIKVRSLFKFLSYWKGDIVTDKNGQASFSFKTPDNLTGWRILAIANDKKDQLGLGQGHFKVNQPLEIRPAIPNQVSEGDEFEARFIISNRTKTVQSVTVSVSAEGNLAADPELSPRKQEYDISSYPFKREIISLKVKAGKAGKIRFTAIASSEAGRDAAKFELTVRKQETLLTAATYGTTTRKLTSELLKIPEDIRTDSGNIQVNLSPTVIANLSGAFEYMKNYPYSCWEQKLTKSVMASHYQGLKSYLPKTFKWKSSRRIISTILKQAASHQAPNGGMSFFKPDNHYVSNYLSAYTALAFTWLAQNKHTIPADVQKNLLAYIKSLLNNKTLPNLYNQRMHYTLQAVILAALAKTNNLSPAVLKRYASLSHTMSLFGKAHFLIALSQFPTLAQQQQEVADQIQAHVNESGGKYIYQESLNSAFKHMLDSDSRTQCAILSARLAYESQPRVKASDIPYKLVRSITQNRKRNNRWENPQDNIFCANALMEYSRIYEKTKPAMSLTSFIGKQKLGNTKFMDFRKTAVTLTRPFTADDPGNTLQLNINKSGKGRYYYSAIIQYAPIKPSYKPVNSGITIKREYSVERHGQWLKLKSPLQLKQGELVRVDLFVNLPAPRYFVVVNDSVPGGLEPVNTQLATASQFDANKASLRFDKKSYWHQHKLWRYFSHALTGFYHREMLHHSVRYYSEYLTAGNYHLSYVAQAIVPGSFTAIPAQAEEMYDPDVFGKSSTVRLLIKSN